MRRIIILIILAICLVSLAKASYAPPSPLNVTLILKTPYSVPDPANVTLILDEPSISNSAPTVPEIGGPADGARTIGNLVTLRCENSTDADGDTINYEFYGDTGAATTLLQNSTLTTYVWTTTDGQTYYWRCRANDNYSASSYTITKSFIENSLPSAVDLVYPANNEATTNRTPQLNWSQATDSTDNTFTYQVNITCYPACPLDNRLFNNSESLSLNNWTTLTSRLKNFWDDLDYYNWTVRAWDGYEFGPWNETPSTLKLSSVISLSMVTPSVNFTLQIGETANTTTDSPAPLQVRNDGNSFVNVNMSNATNLVWQTQQAASSYYRYKIDNVSTELGSFNWTGSITSWTNVPIVNNTPITYFNYSDTSDEAEIDILVTVPPAEPPGQKESQLIFTGWYVREY